MNIESNAKQPPRVHLRKPPPDILEKKSDAQIKLLLLTVLVVTVAWVGALLYLGRELLNRLMS